MAAPRKKRRTDAEAWISGQVIRERCARLDDLERTIRRLTDKDGNRIELGKAKAAAWAAEMSEDELVFYVDAGMKALPPTMRQRAVAYFTAYDRQVKA